MKRTLLYIAAAVGLLVCSVLMYESIVGHLPPLFVSKATIDGRINAYLEKEKPINLHGRFAKYVKDVTPRAVELDLREDHTIAARITATGRFVLVIPLVRKTLTKNFSATIRVEGTPELRSKALYLRRSGFTVESFTLEGEPPSASAKQAIERYVSNTGVRHLLTDLADHLDEFLQDMAENLALRALDKRPVYDPKGDLPGIVFSYALDKIDVVKDGAYFFFTVKALFWTFFMWALIALAVVGFAFFLYKHPDVAVTIGLLDGLLSMFSG